MTDRLSNIWSRFSQRTQLDLSGANIDAVPRPSQTRLDGDTSFLTAPLRSGMGAEGQIDPVGAALTAMHAQMADAARHPKTGPVDPAASFAASPETSLEKTLFADIAFTRSKTERSMGDYIAYAAGRQLDWQKRKKKRFFGLF